MRRDRTSAGASRPRRVSTPVPCRSATTPNAACCDRRGGARTRDGRAYEYRRRDLNPHGRCPRRSERRVSAIPPRRRAYLLPPVCLPPESNGTVGRFRPAFRPRKLDRRQRREAEPTGYDPATSHVTGGRAADCATAPGHSGASDVARRTDDDLTRESRLVRDRHPPTGHSSSLWSCVLRHTHEPSVVKELGSPRKRRSPHLALRAGGAISRPVGSVGGPMPPGPGPPIPCLRCTSCSYPADRDLGSRSRRTAGYAVP